MAEMEFRGWIRVPGVHIESEEAERLLSTLERESGELGPVLSGASGGAVDVVLAVDSADEATAARRLFSATADAVTRAGLAGRYPTSVTIEPVEAPAVAGIH
jgi:hypothetical protein